MWAGLEAVRTLLRPRLHRTVLFKLGSEGKLRVAVCVCVRAIAALSFAPWEAS